MSAKPLVVVLIGPGGVGKGSVARRLVERDDHLWLSRSWTTRPPRASERGDEYCFVDRAVFERAIREGAFLEWAEFHGNLYGTPLVAPPDGRDLLLEIDVQGAASVRALVPDALIVLLEAPSSEGLEARLRQRGDDEEHVRARLASAPAEIAAGRALADLNVVNDEIERACDEILSILDRRRSERRTSKE